MSDESTVVRTFSNEMDAAMAQQVLEDSGIKAFIFKDDAGGMEPQLQMTNGVRLITARSDAQRASDIIQSFEDLTPALP